MAPRQRKTWLNSKSNACVFLCWPVRRLGRSPEIRTIASKRKGKKVSKARKKVTRRLSTLPPAVWRGARRWLRGPGREREREAQDGEN